MEESGQVVQQTTMVLPYFDEEIPVLCLRDGSSYIPVIELCRMLGLRADVHIARWRTLMLWHYARKLPWRTQTGRTRIVWCLHVGALPFLSACFNWSLVTPLRQAQLQNATDAWLTVAEQAHKQMLAEYREMRRVLFDFLLTYASIDEILSQPALSPSLFQHNNEERMQFERLVARGRDLIQQATHHARHMLQENDASPILDVVQLGRDGDVEEVGSQPLFPVIPRRARAQFDEYLTLLMDWLKEFAACVRSAGAS